MFRTIESLVFLFFFQWLSLLAILPTLFFSCGWEGEGEGEWGWEPGRRRGVFGVGVRVQGVRERGRGHVVKFNYIYF